MAGDKSIACHFTKYKNMKNKIILVLIVLISSCNNAKEASVQDDNRSNTNTKESLTTYRYIISFISKGSGVDQKAKENLNTYIKNYNSKNNTNVSYDAIKWGREGEVDYCFQLSELNKDQQSNFIFETKELLKISDLIRFSENEKCKNQRNN